MMKPQTTHAEAAVYIRKGTLDELPTFQSIGESLRSFGQFKAPEAIKRVAGKTKDDRYCKGCFTRHPIADFVMADGYVHKNYCRTQADRIAKKKARLRGVI